MCPITEIGWGTFAENVVHAQRILKTVDEMCNTRLQF